MGRHRLGHAQQQRKQKSEECREGRRKDVQAVAEGLNGSTREPEMRSNCGRLTALLSELHQSNVEDPLQGWLLHRRPGDRQSFVSPIY